MFWFPEPKKVNESVIKFLDFEKNYLTNGWTVDKIFVLLAILLFFSFYFIQPGIEIGNIYNLSDESIRNELVRPLKQLAIHLRKFADNLDEITNNDKKFIEK